jgi:hypothetical protein
MGASVILCDIDKRKAGDLSSSLHAVYGPQAPTVKHARILLDNVPLIVDASPAERIIEASMIKPETIIVAPGVPHGLTPEAQQIMTGRFYHDNLAIGVATMVLAAAANRLTMDLNTNI